MGSDRCFLETVTHGPFSSTHAPADRSLDVPVKWHPALNKISFLL